jgi:toxin ParE1/3/4
VIRRAVRLTEEAEHDIESIYDYIATHDSIASAEHVWRGIENCWSRLETLSERGNVPKEISATGNREYRELHWKPYRIIYRLERTAVTVYAIVDGRRDIRTFLRQRLSLRL